MPVPGRVDAARGGQRLGHGPPHVAQGVRRAEPGDGVASGQERPADRGDHDHEGQQRRCRRDAKRGPVTKQQQRGDHAQRHSGPYPRPGPVERIGSPQVARGEAG